MIDGSEVISKTNVRPTRVLIYPILLASLHHWSAPVFGQSTFSPVTVRTGGTQSLISTSQPLATLSFPNAAPLQFDFAFGTDEVFAPNTIFDSFTITLQDNSFQSTFVILTADASGVAWAPPTPGALVVDPDSIQRSAISFPALQYQPAQQIVLHFIAPSPEDLAGQPAPIFLDLFENQNGQESFGCFHLTEIPEPASAGLALLGFAVCRLMRRLKR